MKTFTQMSRITGGFLRHNGPVILTGLGGAGLISTAYLTGKAAFKASAILSLEEERSFKEDFKKTWMLYIPPAIVGAAAIVCIFGANSLNVRRQAAVVSAYSLSEKAFKEYREKVVETVGVNKEKKVRADIAQDHVNQNPPVSKEIIITSGGEVLCKDSLTGRYFRSSVETIKSAQNEINAKCINEMYASHNDFHRLVGLPPTAFGEEVGWRTDHMLDISFSSSISPDGQPCLELTYDPQPIYGYYKFY